MKLGIFLCFALFINICVCKDAVDLNESNFDYSTHNGKWLLEFKRITPFVEEAASVIKREKLDLKVGIIDCEANKELCKRNGVPHYPLIKYSAHGRISDFHESYTADAIVNFAKLVSQPAVDTLTSQTFASGTSRTPVNFLLVRNGESDRKNLEKDYMSIAEQFFSHRESSFHVISVVVFKEKLEDFVVKPSGEYTPIPISEYVGDMDPFLVVINDHPRLQANVYEGPLRKDLMVIWVEDHMHPLLGELTHSNFDSITKNGKPTFVLVFDHDDPRILAIPIELIRDVAMQHTDSLTFCWINISSQPRFKRLYGLSSGLSLLIVDAPKQLFWTPSDELPDPFTNQAAERFLSQWFNGELEAGGSGSGMKGKIIQTIRKGIIQFEAHPMLWGTTSFLVLLLVWLVYYAFTLDLEEVEKPHSE